MFSLVNLNPVIADDSNTAGLAWEFDSGLATFDFLANGESLVLTYTVQVTDSQGATDDNTVVITIGGTNDAPTITGEVVSKNETNAPLTATGTLDVEDLDTSDTVSAQVIDLTFDDTGILNGTEILQADLEAMFSLVNLNPVIADDSNTAGLAWEFDSGLATFDFLANGESLVLTYTVQVTDSQGATDDNTVVITIGGTNDAPTITGEVVSKNETNAPLTATGTLDVEDLDTSDTVSAQVIDLTFDDTGILNGTEILQADLEAMFSLVNLNPVIADDSNTAGLAWEFDSGLATFDFLANGESLVLTYTVQVTDSQGATDDNTVVITIGGTNDAPTITGEVVSKNETNAPLTATGTLDVEDLDTSDTVSAQVIDLTFDDTGILNGTEILQADLEAMFSLVNLNPVIADDSNTAGLAWEFDSGLATFDFLANGESLVLTYTVQVTDSQGATDDNTVVITIGGTNDAPTITGEVVSKNETNAPLTATGTLDVEDLDTSDTVSAQVIDLTFDDTGILNGTEILQADLEAMFSLVNLNPVIADDSNTAGLAWEFDSGLATFDFLANGESLVLTYTVQVTDSQGATDDNTVVITIGGTNDAPTITGEVVSKNETNAPLTATGTLDVEDLDTSDTVSAQVIDLTFDDTGILNGTEILQADLEAMFSLVNLNPVIADDSNTAGLAWEFDSGLATFDFLANGESLVLTYTVQVTDSQGATDDNTVVITIGGTNDAPTITGEVVSKNETNAPLTATGTLDVEDLDTSDTVSAQVIDLTFDDTGILNGTEILQADLEAMFSLVNLNPVIADDSNTAGLAWEFDSGLATFDFLANGESLVLTYTVQVTDSQGATDDNTVVITIGGTNDAPTITGEVVSKNETNAPLTATGTLDVEDLDTSDTVSAQVIDLTFDDTGILNGTEILQADLEAMFSLVNLNPVIADDSNTAGLAWEFDSGLATFDFLANGESLVLTYTVQVTDSQGATDDNTVVITIGGTNDAPTITGEVVSKNETNAPLTATGTLDVEDLDTSDTVSAQVIDLTFDDTGILNGTEILQADLEAMFSLVNLNPVIADDSNTAGLAWEFDSGLATFDFLANGESLVLTYTVQVTDSQGATDDNTVVITIGGTNDAPTITGEVVSKNETNAPLTATGTLDVEDLDTSDTVSAQVIDLTFDDTGILNGTEILQADLEAMFSLVNLNPVIADDSNTAGLAWEFDSGLATFDFLANGESLVLTYTVQVTDSQGATDDNTVVITIGGTNDAPTITGEVVSKNETNAPLTATGTLDVEDLDTSDTVSAQVIDLTFDDTGILNGTEILQADLEAMFSLVNLNPVIADDSNTAGLAWEFDSGLATFDFLANGESLVLTYTVQVTDSQGATDDNTVVITIGGTNDAPTITGEVVSKNETNAPLTATGTLDVEDLDTSDTVSAQVIDLTFDDTGILNGTEILQADLEAMFSLVNLNPVIADDSNTAGLAWEFDSGLATFDFLANGESLVLTYTVQVTDSQGATDDNTVVITIGGTNDAPTITGEVVSKNETNAPLTATGTLDVEDLDTSDTVSAQVIDLTFDDTGILNGTEILQADLEAMFSLVNLNPVIADDSNTAGLAWEFDSGLATFDFLANGESLVLTYTVQVTDSQGATDDNTVVITIGGTNDAPTITGEVVSKNETNAPLTATGTLDVEDLDTSDTVSAQVIDLTFDDTGILNGTEILQADLEAMFSLVNLNPVIADDSNTAGLAWEFDSGLATFDFLANGESLVLTYTVQVTDSQGATDDNTVVITIGGTNDAPTITGEVVSKNETNAPLTATGTLDVEDLDTSDTVSAQVIDLTFDDTGILNGTEILQADLEAMFSLVNLNPVIADDSNTAGLAWEFDSGLATFDFLANGESLVLTYTVQVTDSQGATDDNTVVITIGGTNDAPTITGEVVSKNETNAPLTATGTLDVEDLDTSDTVSAQVIDLTFDDTGILNGTEILQADLEAMFSLVNLNPVIADDSNTAGLAWEFDSGLATFDFLANGESLVLTYTVQVTDSQGATDDNTVVITIGGTNDAPTITGEVVSKNETNAPLTATGTLDVEDLDTSDTVSAQVIDLTFDDTGILNGTEILQADLEAMFSLVNLNPVIADDSNTAGLAWEFDSGLATFDFLANGESLVLTYTVQVTDSQGATDDNTVVITIGGTNDAPTITGEVVSKNETNAPLTATGTLDVEDLDTSDTVSAQVIDLTFDDTGILNGTEILQADLEAMFSLVNLNPVIADDSNTAGLAWEFDSGLATFDFLANGESLVLTYTVQVTDSQGATDDNTVVITIGGTNDAPTITGEVVSKNETNAPLTATGTLDVEDLDTSDTVSAQVIDLTFDDTGILNGTEILQADLEAMFSLVNLNPVIADDSNTAGLAWEFDSGLATFDFLANGESLVLTYTVQVTDSQGATDDNTVVITIGGTNDAPTITGEVVSKNETNAPLTATGTLDVEDLDTSDTVSAQVIDLTFDDTGILNGTEILQADLEAMFSLVNLNPVIADDSNTLASLGNSTAASPPSTSSLTANLSSSLTPFKSPTHRARPTTTPSSSPSVAPMTLPPSPARSSARTKPTLHSPPQALSTSRTSIPRTPSPLRSSTSPSMTPASSTARKFSRPISRPCSPWST